MPSSPSSLRSNPGRLTPRPPGGRRAAANPARAPRRSGRPSPAHTYISVNAAPRVPGSEAPLPPGTANSSTDASLSAGTRQPHRTSFAASNAKPKTRNAKPSPRTPPAPPPPSPSPHFTPARLLRSLRARFNPIRHLSPDSLARALDSFQLGDLRPAALLWDAMERRDDVLQGVTAKRKKSVARLDWEILAVDSSPAAARHRAALEYFYNNLTATHACDPHQRGGLALLIKQMLDALGKKYAIHEIVRQPAPASPAPNSAEAADAGTTSASNLSTAVESPEPSTKHPNTKALTATFRFAPLWFFEARSGRLRFLPDDSATDGVDLAPGQWLVTVADGLMESSSIAYLFKHLPLRDWLVYCERNGMPGVRAVTDAAPGSAEWDAAREAVRDFGAEFHALMSRGTDIEAIDLTARGELPYPALVERMDRALAALWRGADLATLSQEQSVGSSVQSHETELLEEDDAGLVSETLNAQVDAQVIRQLFGDETPRAYFRLLPRQDSSRLAHLELLERLHNLGVPLPLAGLHERLGLPNPAANETKPSSPAANYP